jgi:putative endonuclease
MNYVYMLRCGDGTLYTGWTNDLERRVATHAAGRGAKYTRSHLPVTLCYSETFETKEAAMRREAEIKHLTREQKLALIEGADK